MQLNKLLMRELMRSISLKLSNGISKFDGYGQGEKNTKQDKNNK